MSLNREDHDLRRYLEAIRKESVADPKAHPSQDEIVSYHRQELPESEIESMRTHLVECVECADVLRDVRDFFGDDRDSAEASVSDRDLEVKWNRFRGRLSGLQEPQGGPAAGSAVGSRWSPAWAAGLVAAVALASIGILEVRHRGELSRLRQPAVNAPIYDVFPLESTTRSNASEAPGIRVPLGVERFVLLLYPSEAPPSADHRVEIRDASERVLWSAGGLSPNSDGSFVVTVDRSFLGSGAFRLVVSGSRGDGRPFAEYRVTLD